MKTHLPITDVEYKEDSKGSRILLFSEKKCTSHPFTPLYILPKDMLPNKSKPFFSAPFSKLQELKDSLENPPLLLSPERQFLLENNLSYYTTKSYGLPNISFLEEPLSNILKTESQQTIETVIKSLIKTKFLNTKEKNTNLLENFFFKARLPLTKNPYPKTPNFTEKDLSLIPLFLLSSHAQVKPTTDALFYKSFLDEFALFFHKTNTGQKERFERNKIHRLDYYPIGPLYRSQTYTLPLIDVLANSDFFTIQSTGKNTNPHFSQTLNFISSLSSFLTAHRNISKNLEKIYTQKHKILFYKELQSNPLYLYSRLTTQFLDSELKSLPSILANYKEFTKELSILSSLKKSTISPLSLRQKALQILA